jgi:hypothetical protein
MIQASLRKLPQINAINATGKIGGLSFLALRRRRAASLGLKKEPMPHAGEGDVERSD